MLLVHRQVAPHVRRVGVAAAIQHRDDAFVLVELLELRLKLRGLATAAAWLVRRRIVRRRRARAARAASALRGNRRRLGFLRQLAVHPDDERPFEHAHRARRLPEHDLALELSPVFREVGLTRDGHAHDVGGDGAVGAGRPRLRKPDERLDLRRDQVGAEPLERPAPSEVPVLAMDVREAPLRHLLHRPRAGFVHRGRAGEARTVAVGEPEERLHGLRAVEPFVADLGQSGEVELFGLRLRRRRSFRLQAESSGHGSRHQKSEQSHPAHIRRILSSSHALNQS
jgi:hypothetical protein